MIFITIVKGKLVSMRHKMPSHKYPFQILR